MHNEIEHWTQRIKAGFLKYGLPGYMEDGVKNWVVDGIEPGSFLCALFANDLMSACGQADDINRHLIFQWAGLLYNDVPSECKGSWQRMDEWQGLKKMQGPPTEEPKP